MNQPQSNLPALPDEQNQFMEAIDERTSLSNAYLEMIYHGLDETNTQQQNAVLYVAQHMADLTSFARHADLVIKGFAATLKEADERIEKLAAQVDEARSEAEEAYDNGFYAGEESAMDSYYPDEADTESWSEGFDEGFARAESASETKINEQDETIQELEAELETERSDRARIADELAAYQDWYQQYTQGKTA